MITEHSEKAFSRSIMQGYKRLPKSLTNRARRVYNEISLSVRRRGYLKLYDAIERAGVTSDEFATDINLLTEHGLIQEGDMLPVKGQPLTIPLRGEDLD